MVVRIGVVHVWVEYDREHGMCVRLAPIEQMCFSVDGIRYAEALARVISGRDVGLAWPIVVYDEEVDKRIEEIVEGLKQIRSMVKPVVEVKVI